MTAEERRKLNEELARALGWVSYGRFWWNPLVHAEFNEVPAFDSHDQSHACIEFCACRSLLVMIAPSHNGWLSYVTIGEVEAEGATWTEALARATIAAAQAAKGEA